MPDKDKRSFIGLMSGTSMDGIDAVLVDFTAGTPQVLAALSTPLSTKLRTQLFALIAPGPDEIERMGRLSMALGREFGRASLSLLEQANIGAQDVAAIGSHGQTIRHRPTGPDAFTLQIGHPAVIAEVTGITTVGDFRTRDIAAGGQGAPLVPAFHAATFRSPQIDRVVLNIGGMANITVLPARAEAPVFGFDTGPGNVLLDLWADTHLGTRLDAGGAWAAGGRVIKPLLEQMLSEAYFAAPPPKSTGRELFNRAWLEAALSTCGLADSSAAVAQDIQATLCALTACSIADAIHRYAPSTGEVLVCGGGWHNTYLIAQLQDRLANCAVVSTEACGLAPQWVEATAFAWLARQALLRLPGNLPAVTGAREAVVLGGIYPGKVGESA